MLSKKKRSQVLVGVMSYELGNEKLLLSLKMLGMYDIRK